jgi:hypothetical protein
MDRRSGIPTVEKKPLEINLDPMRYTRENADVELKEHST